MISIVIPLYNKENCICKTIDSVLAQTYAEWECIVVDDGSTDRSCSLVEHYNDGRIRLLRKQNGGPSSARNFGVKHATGEWIIFLDADDIFFSDALETFHQLSIRYPNINCFSSNYDLIKNNKKIQYSYLMHNGLVRNPYRSWLFKMFMPRTGASMFRRVVLMDYPFDETLRRYEDADLIIRILESENFVNTKRSLMAYNTDEKEASLKRNNISIDYLGHLRISEKMDFWKQVLIYTFYQKAKMVYPYESSKIYKDSDFCKSKYLIAKFCVNQVIRINLFLQTMSIKK